MEVKCFKDSSIYTLLLFLVVALALKKGSYKPTYFPLEMELKKDAIRLVIFLMLLIFPVIILRFGINSMTDAYLIHFSLCGLWLLVSLNWIYGVPAVY